MVSTVKFAGCMAKAKLRHLAMMGFCIGLMGLSGCSKSNAEMTFDCVGADADSSLTMKFANGKLAVTDSLGSVEFPATQEGELDKVFNVSGAVTREMMVPDPAALDACISAELTKLNRPVSDKNALGASRQNCALQLASSETKQSVDVTYSAIGTEVGLADVLIHLQYKAPSTLVDELLYINRTPQKGCTTKLVP